MPTKLYLNTKIKGVLAPDGGEYVSIKQDRTTWFVRRAALLTDPAATIATLAEQGLVAGGRGYNAQITEDAREITDFNPREVLPHPGWNGLLFARGDGEILSPRAASPGNIPGVAYYRYPARFRRSGRRKDWKRDIAPELLKNDMATFLMCLPFAAVVHALMRAEGGPPAFELVTTEKQGAVLRVVLSVTGSMAGEGLAPDPIERVLREPERHIEASRHNLLIVGDIEGYLSGVSDKKRSNAVRQLVFDHLLARVGSMNGKGAPAPAFVTVGSQPLAVLLGLDPTSTDRLRQTVPVINIPAGTFSRRDDRDALIGLPKAVWGNASDKMVTCFGHALREFQRRLVERRGQIGLAKLQTELSKSFETFRAKAGSIAADGHVADELVHPFALVYAAFRMAEQLKVLPTTKFKQPAVWTVFKGFMADRPKQLTAAKILAELADGPGTLRIEDIGASMSKAELQNVPAFTKQIKDGKRELWVLTSQKKVVFDWPTFSKLPDYEAHFRGKGEPDRMGGKRVIGKWQDARVIRFRLP